MICLRGGSGARSGTGTGLVGEQSPLDAVHHDGAESAGGYLAKPECLGENASEDRGQEINVDDDEDDRHQQIDACHDRYHDVQHPDGGIFAKNDDRTQDDQDDGGVQRRNMECIFKSGCHGVADHLADAEPADQAGEGKQHGQWHITTFFTASLLKIFMNIVSRTAPPSAVERVFFFVELGESCLDKCGGRADDGSHPHPEDSAGAPGGDGGNHAHQIAHADTGRRGHDQCLENRQRAVFFIFSADHSGDHIFEQTHRENLRTDGEVDPCGNQQDHQDGQRKRSAAGKGKIE